MILSLHVNKILVANKADMDESKRAVPTAKGKALADEYGINFFETSAKTNLNLESVFLYIAKDIKQRSTETDATAEVVPFDIQREILLRLPLVSLVRFRCVCKKWDLVFEEKMFIDDYLLRPMERPRLLFVYDNSNKGFTDVVIHSHQQEEEPVFSSLYWIRIPMENVFASLRSVRGFVCFEAGEKIVFGNPGINKFLTLPEIPASRRKKLSVSFGFNEGSNEFKVLLHTYDGRATDEVDMEHHILTIGEVAWRQIACQQPYQRETSVLCSKGVLYWGAKTHPEMEAVLMSFHLASEQFGVIQLPIESEIGTFDHMIDLVNQEGDIALATTLVEDGYIQMWIRDASSGNWQGDCVVIPSWRQTVGEMGFFFEGFIGRELFFSAHSQYEGCFLVLYYNRNTQRLRKVKIEGLDKGVVGQRLIFPYLDHVDSLSSPRMVGTQKIETLTYEIILPYEELATVSKTDV